MTIRLLAALALLGPGATAEEKPNVLFIAVDDLNAWIGALGGHPQAKTPNLDRLAARGVLFTRAYCAAPACNPSRAALLTGIRPSTSGVYHNDQPWRPALKSAVTLPAHFRQSGYATFGGGKIYHGGYEDAASWDERMKGGGGNPHPERTPANGIPKAGHFDWAPVDVADEEMPDHRLATWAGEVLAREHAKPFFLAVGFVKPHLPWYAPKKYFDLHPLETVALPETDPNDLDDVPPAGVKMAKPEGDHRSVLEVDGWKKAVQAYLATIAFVDAQIGRVVEALDRSPHAKNTLIVLWGDHGWHLGEKRHWRKFALWEEATRAPLLVAGPGVAPGVCRRPVDFMAVYPTLVDLCGVPSRDGLEGRSLAPLLKDPSASWPGAALTTHGKGNHTVRTDRWRYIRYADGTEELYDHEADPRERSNLAERTELAPVKAELAGHLPKGDAPDAPRERK